MTFGPRHVAAWYLFGFSFTYLVKKLCDVVDIVMKHQPDALVGPLGHLVLGHLGQSVNLCHVEDEEETGSMQSLSSNN